MDYDPAHMSDPKPERLPEPAERVIAEVIDLLSASRHTFKSKQIERARHLLEELLRRTP